MATLTLEKMAAGGMYDQLGGGFHRYSTDAVWLVPHFEKMLYDNALLAVAYAEAYQATGRLDFARVARETCDYLLREMASPDGAFYSATDADSLTPDGHQEEGAFFVWSRREIEDVLAPRGADETARFVAHYGVTAEGNFEGANILHVARPDEGAWAALADARAALYAVRARRPPPLRDEKILAAWNGLTISGLAVAGRVLNEPRYVAAAARAATFVLGTMRVEGRLARSWKDGRTGAAGFLEDHAFLTAGLLDLFEATADRRWLEAALSTADETERLFADRRRWVVHDRRRSRAADRARKARLRRRRAVGDLGRAAVGDAPRDADDRRPLARGRRPGAGQPGAGTDREPAGAWPRRCWPSSTRAASPKRSPSSGRPAAKRPRRRCWTCCARRSSPHRALVATDEAGARGAGAAGPVAGRQAGAGRPAHRLRLRRGAMRSSGHGRRDAAGPARVTMTFCERAGIRTPAPTRLRSRGCRRTGACYPAPLGRYRTAG